MTYTSDFLANHLVSDIPVNLMKSIKKEALEKYLPNDRRPIKAWGLAMASLRCLKRDLVKHKNKQMNAYNNNSNNSKEHVDHTTTITPLFSNFSSFNQNLFVNSSSNLLDLAHQSMRNQFHGISENNNNNNNNSLTNGFVDNQGISIFASAHQKTKALSKKRASSEN